MAGYQEFLRSKALASQSSGIDVPAEDLHAGLFPFQRDLVRWSLRKGRSALFADTGLGKSFMALEWARRTEQRTLILAPLSVARQTVREGERWGISVTYARRQEDADPAGITIANYEMLSKFKPDEFGAVVLDESSILKSFEGKTRTALVEAFAAVPFRLCCTATPAPNDIAELANHAEFLGVCSRVEMLSCFFVHDDEGWRLKGHARNAFYRWLASWAMSLKRPSDLGYSDEGYDLPPLRIKPHLIPADWTPVGQLFAIGMKGIAERSNVRRSTLDQRVLEAAALINGESGEPWIAWVGLNDEGRELAALIPDSVLVEGSDTPDQKIDALDRFLSGEVRVLVTKPSISGYGLNLQHCARMAFVGLGDSYEQYYQSIRRCYRFGQKREVEAHVVLTDLEEPIYRNVLRKEAEAERTSAELVKHVREFETAEIGQLQVCADYLPSVPMSIPAWMGGRHAA